MILYNNHITMIKSNNDSIRYKFHMTKLFYNIPPISPLKECVQIDFLCKAHVY